jgi:hypothetical protein
MDVGQELALSFGVGRVHKGLLLVDIDTIHVCCYRPFSNFRMCGHRANLLTSLKFPR